MDSIELFEYSQLCKPTEDQTNSTSSTMEITHKCIVFQVKIQYYLHCVAKMV